MSQVLQQTTTNELYLRLSDCTMRVGRGSRGRPALEVYSGYRLFHVAVAGNTLGPSLLRGALRSRRGELPWALAWGVIPEGQEPPHVQLRRPGFALPVPATVFGDHFWVSTVPGHYRSISVETVDGTEAVVERLNRMRAGRR
ncbi:hypothetical protein [Streptomyces sp. SID3343]|uniref:hypothetical protein n=1 Tax=Streptomyces sp. SID3343 TaxID=2690260 RepID=UPI00136FA0EC|nr:hypothetical protein [Streptomyces sp. SID3343]MYW04859.1 hypothetical protein [Streptomyces sp. SID3343]